MNDTTANSAGTLTPPHEAPSSGPPGPGTPGASGPPGPGSAAERPPLPDHRPTRAAGWRQHPFTKAYIKPLASLRVTVVLFAMSLFLVFVGTLAQTEQGIKYILDGYFRTWIAWIDVQAFVKFGQVFFGFPADWRIDWSFPFFGGYILGWAMFFNLLAAHTLRFKMTARGLNMTLGLTGLLAGLGLMIVASPLSPDLRTSMLTTYAAAAALATITVVMLLFKRWKLGAVLFLAGMLPFLILPATDLFDSAAWRASIVGGLGMLAVVAASVLAFADRAGMVILHLGVVLLLLGEFMTAELATEGNMTLDEGHSANFVENLSRVELAIIDPSNPETNDVIVVPQRFLTNEGQLIDAGSVPTAIPPDGPFQGGLPFDIEVHEYYRNSVLDPAHSSSAVPPVKVTAGDGMSWVSREVPVFSGAKDAEKVDRPAMYATFKDRETGEPLGSYLLSWEVGAMGNAQRVTVDGQTYEVFLRFERTYLPFRLHLIDFNHDVYPGTDKAKDFSSYCRLVDESRGEDRKVRIYMNNPLRHAGLTFFQASFDPRTRTTTVLQVVDNPSWLLPYVSCVLVAGGMLLHFGVRMSGTVREALRSPANTKA